MHIQKQLHVHWYNKWIVLSCAFCTYLIVDGVRFSFGILYVELLDTFKSGKSETAWVGSLQVGLTNLGGVIAGSMVRRFGILRTIITGTVLSCTGLIASSFTSSIYTMYLTYGILPGFGLIMMSLSSVVAIGQNFDEQQSLAMGICQAGGSVGGFVFNPVLQELIQSYGWQGALLIMAGILMNGFVLGLVIHAFSHLTEDSSERKINESSKDKQVKVMSDESLDETHTSLIPKDEFRVDKFGSVTLTIKPTQTFEQSICTMKTFKENANHFESQKGLSDGSLEDHDKVNYPHALREETENTCAAIQNSSDKSVQHRTLDKVLEVIQQVFPYKVLKDRPTFIFLLSAHVRSFGFFVPFVLLPDLAVERDITLEKAAWLASGMGISGAISRVLLGWIADFPSVDRLYLYVFCLLGSGILSAVCPSFYAYWLLMLYACLFGSLMGGECSLTPVICSDVAGRKQLPETYGMLQTLCGIGAMCGTPLSGWLFEATGGYNVSLILAGALITLSGVMLLPIKCQRGVEKNRRTTK